MAQPDHNKRPINWGLAVLLTLLGAALLTYALVLEDFATGAVASTFIEIGAGLGLIAFIVMAERNLVGQIRNVAESAATEAAEKTTADLEQRVSVRLENLEDELAAERQKRREQEQDAVARVLGGEVTAESVGRILHEGFENNLFDSGFRVRTSDDPDGHVLYIDAVSNASVDAVFFDFESFGYYGDAAAYEYGVGPAEPVRTESLAKWTNEREAHLVALELEKALERLNKPLRGFSLAYAIQRIAESYLAMKQARRTPDQSPLRLEGTLQLLINDQWALTSYGLESIFTSAGYETEIEAFSPTGRFMSKKLTVHSLPDDRSGFDEALAWIETREDIRVEYEENR